MEDTCPLTSAQAVDIIKNLEILKENVDNLKETQSELKIDQKSIKLDIQLINSKLGEMQLEIAKDKSFSEGKKSGAGFWFKAGMVATVVSIGAGIIFVASLVTGKISFMDILK